MVEKSLTVLGTFWEETFGQLLQTFAMLFGNGVAGFGLAKVKVVDAIQVHVLHMPGEGGLPQAKVEVGSIDAFNGDAALILHYIQGGVQTANVPFMYVLFIQCPVHISTIAGGIEC